MLEVCCFGVDIFGFIYCLFKFLLSWLDIAIFAFHYGCLLQGVVFTLVNGLDSQTDHINMIKRNGVYFLNKKVVYVWCFYGVR